MFSMSAASEFQDCCQVCSAQFATEIKKTAQKLFCQSGFSTVGKSVALSADSGWGKNEQIEIFTEKIAKKQTGIPEGVPLSANLAHCQPC